MRGARSGFTMVEMAVALLILAVSVAALLDFASAEIQGVDLSLERYSAQLALGELQACWGDRYSQLFEREGFPASEDEFNELYATYLDDHPQTTSIGPGEVQTAPARQELSKQWAAMGLTRMVLFRKERTPDGGEVGIVTFVVTYRSDRGGSKQIRSFEVVY